MDHSHGHSGRNWGHLAGETGLCLEQFKPPRSRQRTARSEPGERLPVHEANDGAWRKNLAMVSAAHGSWSQEATQYLPISGGRHWTCQGSYGGASALEPCSFPQEGSESPGGT